MPTRRARIDALVDVAVGIYAPLPGRSLASLVRRLRFAVPQWRGELTGALQRAKQRLAQARVDGVDWYWPAGEDPAPHPSPDAVRLLTPFDPVVHDRDRFEIFWGFFFFFFIPGAPKPNPTLLLLPWRAPWGPRAPLGEDRRGRTRWVRAVAPSVRVGSRGFLAGWPDGWVPGMGGDAGRISPG